MKRFNTNNQRRKEIEIMDFKEFKESLKQEEFLKKSGVMPALPQTARCQNV